MLILAGLSHPKHGGRIISARPRPFASDVDQLLAFVIPAARADAVGRLGLVAIRALGERGRGERVVGSPLVAARFAVAALRIRHDSVPILSSRPGALSSGDR